MKTETRNWKEDQQWHRNQVFRKPCVLMKESAKFWFSPGFFAPKFWRIIGTKRMKERFKNVKWMLSYTWISQYRSTGILRAFLYIFFLCFVFTFSFLFSVFVYLIWWCFTVQWLWWLRVLECYFNYLFFFHLRCEPVYNIYAPTCFCLHFSPSRCSFTSRIKMKTLKEWERLDRENSFVQYARK